jgi:hypothetical protein
MAEAAGQGCIEVVKWLHEDAPDEAEAKSILRAADRGHFRLVQWLVACCTNVRTILAARKQAISSEYFEVSLLLLDSEKYPSPAQ